MSPLASDNILEIFRLKMQNEWRKVSYCNITGHKHGYDCPCQHPFVRTKLLEDWMYTVDDTGPENDSGKLKCNGERLVDKTNPIKVYFKDKTSDILNRDDPSIRVLSFLLEKGRANLIYIFKYGGFTDKRIRKKLAGPQSGYEKLSETMISHGVENASEFITEFNACIWDYLPAYLDNELDSEDCPDNFFLPFCSRERLNHGGTAEVFRVLIQKEFVSEGTQQALGQLVTKKGYGDCYQMAMKKFSNRQRRTWENEMRAFKTLGGTPGILHCLGGYRTKNKTGTWDHYILLEFAKTDLRNSFGDPNPPLRSQEITDYWENICNVAAAIGAIHMLPHENQIVRGCHMDIKPDNILLVQDEWKLADFGFATFAEQFDQVKPLGGTETYGAPEVARHYGLKSHAQGSYQTSDIWSFGCVLSITATWIITGSDGVDAYETLRTLNQEKTGHRFRTDCFHDGHDVIPEIKEWHDYLKEVKRDSDQVTPAILDLVDKKMLVKDPDARIKSQELHGKLLKVIATAKQQMHSTTSQQVKIALLAQEEMSKQGKPKQFFKLEDISTTDKKMEYLLVPSTSNHKDSTRKSKTPSSTIFGRQKMLEQDTGVRISWIPDPVLESTPKTEAQPPTQDVSIEINEPDGIQFSPSYTVVGEPPTARNLPNHAAPDSRSSAELYEPTDLSRRAGTISDRNQSSNVHILQNDPGPPQSLSHQVTPPESASVPAAGVSHVEIEGFWRCVAASEEFAGLMCEQLIEKDPTLAKQFDAHGLTPIIIAARNFNVSTVKPLLDHSDITYQDETGQTILHHMLLALRESTKPEDESKCLQIIDTILNYQPRDLIVATLDKSSNENNKELLELADGDGHTAIMVAAKDWKLSVVRSLLPYSDLSQRDKKGRTVLHHLISSLNNYNVEEIGSGFLDILEEVPAQEVNSPGVAAVNALDDQGLSPLFLCIHNNLFESAKILISRNAYVNQGPGARDVLVEAIRCVNKKKSNACKMIELLVQKGALLREDPPKLKQVGSKQAQKLLKPVYETYHASHSPKRPSILDRLGVSKKRQEF